MIEKVKMLEFLIEVQFSAKNGFFCPTIRGRKPGERVLNVEKEMRNGQRSS